MTDRVTQYAHDVINGKTIAGRSVRLACERHINDMQRDDFPYIFDNAKANKIFEFAESLILAEGYVATNIKLAPFQAFIFGSLYGWVHRDTGYRRFRESYVQVSRQQGKSMMNGVLGLQISNFDGYQYARVGIGAPKLRQSKIVYREMAKMINADPDLAELFKIQEYKSEIQALSTNGVVEALTRDSDDDGMRYNLGIIDEFHEHPTNDIYSSIKYGQRMLPQCLLSVITTAGDDFNSPCYTMYEYCLKVLENPSSNDQLFIYIAQMDKDDDIWDSKNWIKCMPLLEAYPDMLESIITDGNKAKAIGGKELNDFITKVFNIWQVSGDTLFINVDNWKNKCKSDLTLEDMRGRKAYVGIDLSGGGLGDLSSVGLEFVLDDNQFFIHSMSFMAREHLDKHIQSDHAPYNRWADNGLLELTDGYKTDFKRIISYLQDIRDKYEIDYEMICYDRHNINMLLSDLSKFGCPVVDIVQSARNLSEATLDFRLSVDEGKILYNKNSELLTWSVINAKLEYNSFKEAKIIKNSDKTKRIDAVDSIINAHKMAMVSKNHININDLITEDSLKEMGW